MAGIEMWERFSFYGMQAILVFYLYATVVDGGLGLERADATALVGAYGALVYLFTYCGGWISDRILGPEKTLLTGAGLLMLGHACLSTIPGLPGLALGLIPIALGSGLLKTAAITILGIAFGGDDGKREGAFNIFYLGINVGALGGPLLTGWLAQQVSYHAGFLAAALFMLVGCIMYAVVRPGMLRDFAEPTLITRAPRPVPAKTAALVVLAGVAVALIGAGIVSFGAMTTILLVATTLLALSLFVIILRSADVSPGERRSVRSFIPLFICSTTYWAIFAQNYGVLAVYSDQRLDRTIGDFTMPASWTQSLNPFYILVFTLPLAYLWARLGTRMPRKHTIMSVGTMMAGSSMFLLLPFVGGGANSTPVIVLALCVMLMTLGELLIGPIGMAASTAHAPRAFATRFSALYFLSMAIGTSLAGSISRFYNPDSPSSEATYLLVVGAVPIVIGLVVLLYSLKSARKAPSGAREKSELYL